MMRSAPAERRVSRLIISCVLVLLGSAHVDTGVPATDRTVAGGWTLTREQPPLPLDEIRRCVEGRDTDTRSLERQDLGHSRSDPRHENLAAERVATVLSSIIDVPDSVTIVFGDNAVMLTDGQGRLEKFAARSQNTASMAGVGRRSTRASWNDKTWLTIDRTWSGLGTMTKTYVIEPEGRLHVRTRFTHAMTRRSVIFQRVYHTVAR